MKGINPVQSSSGRWPLWALFSLVLGGCADPLDGPSVMALPGTGRGFDQFRVDDSACRAYAFDQVQGRTVSGTATETTLAGAAVGTAVGAAIGAAANGSQGAGVGAATGLALGGLTGAGLGAESGYTVQRRYDHAYIQCMYAKGNRVPVSGDFAQAQGSTWGGTTSIPPPPPGRPPPPPPDAY
jgi:hypothetical protein